VSNRISAAIVAEARIGLLPHEMSLRARRAFAREMALREVADDRRIGPARQPASLCFRGIVW